MERTGPGAPEHNMQVQPGRTGVRGVVARGKVLPAALGGVGRRLHAWEALGARELHGPQGTEDSAPSCW